MVNFSAGDKVELLNGGSEFPLKGFENGQEYEIIAMPGSPDHDDREHSADGRIMVGYGTFGDKIGYAMPDQLHKTEQPAFPNGSIVKLIAGGGEFPLLGFANGTEYEVRMQPGEYGNGKHSKAGRIQIKKIGGSSGIGYPLPSQIELVKPEPKVGDRVKSVRGCWEGNSGIVFGVREPGFISANKGLRYKTDEGQILWDHIADVEIVKPAASAPESSSDEIKVGDRIRKLAGFGAGEEGTVTAIRPPGYSEADRGLTFKTDSGREIWAFIKWCEKVEPEKSFKIGDTVKVVSKKGSIGFGAKIGDVGEVIDYSTQEKDRALVKFSRHYQQYIDFVDLEIVEHPNPAPKFEVGDHVRGLPSASRYGYTNEKMTRAEVVDIREMGGKLKIFVKVLEHAGGYRGNTEFPVDPQYFEKIEKPAAKHAFKKGDKVRSVSTGKEYTLADRKPSCDGSGWGTAWGLQEKSTWLGEKQFELVEAAAPAPKFSAGEKARSKAFGDIYTLKDRVPEYDGKYGVAWKCTDGGWIGEDQIEKLEQPVSPKFRVGDRVKSIAGVYTGETGEIVAITPEGEGCQVRFDSGTNYKYFSRIEIVEAAAAAAIQVGDRVIGTAAGYRPGVIGTVEKFEHGRILHRPDEATKSTRSDGLISEDPKNLVKIAE